jgi:hypothetical protein
VGEVLYEEDGLNLAKYGYDGEDRWDAAGAC